MRKITLLVIGGVVGILGLAALLMMREHPSGNASLRQINSVPPLHNGDIIFQTSRSAQSKAIQLATKSKYSHMGIIYESHGEFYVYEAVQPVKMTRLREWIKRGEQGKYVVKRLRDQSLLSPENLERMKTSGERFKGKNYDLYFEWSDESIYCSELVWKIYKESLGIEIGKPANLRDFDLENETVRMLMRKRYGERIPLDQIVISPAAMFDSDQLITVTGQ
jgi:hypothetical protein